MADEVIERLVVALEAEYSKLVSGTKQGVKLSEDELKKIDKQAKKSFDEAGKSATGFFGKIKSLAASAVTAFGLVSAAITAVIVGIKSLTNASLEAAKAQFNLTSSIQSANREFGTAIGTTESWKRNIKNLGDQLKIFGNQDVNNATSRLIDMTKRLGLTEEQMLVTLSRSADLAAGKTDLAGAVERVSAAMRGEAESAEFLGLSLNENSVKAFAEAHGLVWKELSEAEKAQQRYQLFLHQTNELQGRASDFAKTRAGQEAILNAQLETQAAVLGEQLMPVMDGYNQLLNNLTAETETSSSIITNILAGLAASLVALGLMFAQIGNRITNHLQTLVTGYKQIWDAVQNLENPLPVWLETNKKIIENATTPLVTYTELWQESFRQIKEGWKQQRKDLENTPFAPSSSGPQLPLPVPPDKSKVDEILDRYSSELLDFQEQTNKELEQNAQEHQAALTDILEEGTKERLEAGKEYQEQLAKLEAETTEEQTKAIRNAAEEIRRVEEETDRKLSDEREDFQLEEKRGVEDHLRVMRRLRGQYLFDLEGAIKNRDARAIVDLRRQFNLEKSQREEDFTTRQRRERQDQDRRLEEIRQEESRRTAEIIANRERELQEIAIQEANKKEQLQASYTEQIAEINAREAEKLAKEQETFETSQAQLQTAMEERLKAIAKSLGNELELTEENAAEVLAKLSEYFGEDGLIDQLMNDFLERRKQKLVINVGVEGSTEETPASFGGGQSSGGGVTASFAQGGAMIVNRPTRIEFGEAGPELGMFLPLAQMQQAMTSRQSGMGSETTHRIEFSGSAPPGIRSSERDQVAGIVLQALREAGVNFKR